MSTKNHDEIAGLIEERAPTITMIELADRRAQSLAGNVVPLRASGRRPPIRVAAVLGAAAVVAAVVVAGAFQLSGGQVRPQAVGSGPQHRVGRHQPVEVKLTAARVHQIARASGVALATQGHVIVHNTDVLGPYPDGAGTMDITFSHQNFNIVYSQPGTSTSIERVVGGRIFLFGYPPPGQPLQWYMSTTQTSGGQAVPDPRSLLAALQPTAGFVDSARGDRRSSGRSPARDGSHWAGPGSAVTRRLRRPAAERARCLGGQQRGYQADGTALPGHISAERPDRGQYHHDQVP